MTMPNFLLIGAPKAATTSVCQYLTQHPQVFMSELSKPHFFSLIDRFEQFPNPQRKNYPNENYFQCAVIKHKLLIHVPKTLSQYQKLFEGAKGHVAIGEGSDGYFGDFYSHEKIKQYLPDVKLVLILRNPVDRIYSEFNFQRRIGWEPLHNFGEALNDVERRKAMKWFLPVYYFENGLYFKYLNNLYRKFQKCKIKVLFYDDLLKDSTSFMKALFAFLGVDQKFPVCLKSKHNAYRDYRGVWARQTDGVINNPVVKTVYRALVPTMAKAEIHKIKNRLLTRDRPPPMNDGLKKALQEYYEQDINSLEKLLDKNLSDWKQTVQTNLQK